MNTFKQRLQPVIDGLPDGEDKDTLIALIDYHESLEQSGFHPRKVRGRRASIFGSERPRSMTAPQVGRPVGAPGKPSGRKAPVK